MPSEEIPICRTQAKSFREFLQRASARAASSIRLTPRGSSQLSGPVLRCSVVATHGGGYSEPGGDGTVCDVMLSPLTLVTFWDIPGELDVSTLRGLFDRHGLLYVDGPEWSEGELRNGEALVCRL